MSITRLFGAAAIGALVAYLVLQEFSLREPRAYDCSEPATIVLKKQLLSMPRYLELYVTGWVHEGSVTVEGMPSRRSSNLDETTFAEDSEISLFFVGDWYTDDVSIKFEPTEDASCHILVRYRLR